MPLDRHGFLQFKSLLLGLDCWNDPSQRWAFLLEAFWGEEWLNRLHRHSAGEEAAVELVELLNGLESRNPDGLSHACTLFTRIRSKFGASPTGRGPVLTQLEFALCRADAPIRSVLFIAANAEHQDPDLDRLRTDLEYKGIREALGRAAGPAALTLHAPEFAARPADLTRALHATQPGVVHFSGHGEGVTGLYFEDGPGPARLVSGDALASVFRLFKHCVKVVVLNACYSEPQAKAIAADIDYVIGTAGAIGDAAALAFSAGFYQALAAGRGVADAFQAGCAQVRLEGLPEHAMPVLMRGPAAVTTGA
ncbi:CHAT domain-containing protein [uncultured Thiodictyon sp.]|uniref:CHAT domain-containing protein n=1 Tax=uncultured Thiodictyon sp. TaxID=1846217 RepID=UPI0025FC704E|nr:CHAT domain-containing protein [uncultured Thiodictyon sp.]